MNGDYASEKHPIIDPFADRVCVGCGCTDHMPCVEDGEPCRWVEGVIDDGDICSACVAIAEALIDAESPVEAAPEIVCATDLEAQQFIEETRPKRFARGRNAA